MSTLKNINTRVTPQSQAVLGKDQKQNNAGGYVFSVNDKTRLERFLILGTESGTFYSPANKVTEDNAKFLADLIKRDENLVAEVVKDVSSKNRAKKVDPTLFAAAALFQFGENKTQAREVFDVVVRTGTHLFDYVQYLKNLGGLGRAKRKALASWYEDKNEDQLAYQLVKYRQRNGWTHRDVLRLAHATPSNANAQFALSGVVAPEASNNLVGFQKAQNASTVDEAVTVLNEHKNLPWEVLPTVFHKEARVWKTLFNNGALRGTALVRNLTRMARLSMFNDLNFAFEVANQIKEDVSTARIHPLSYLIALVVHTEGQTQRSSVSYFSARRKKDWETSDIIVRALTEAYYNAFEYVESANKRTLLAVDVSGSMGQSALGSELSCAQVAGAMAMTVARTEPKSLIRGFTTGTRDRYRYRGSANLTDLGIGTGTDLNNAMKKVQSHNFGGTDCAQPMLWALENKVDIDTFIVITDNETWHGKVHPFQALKQYRKATGIDARLIVLGCAATEFSIADPSDKGMLDIAGFDSAAPAVIADFSAGRI